MPYGFHNKSVTSLIQLGKSYVVQIVVQPFDLLRQGYWGVLARADSSDSSGLG